jgi:hypothetical protein
MNEIALVILLPLLLIVILIFTKSNIVAKWIGVVGSFLLFATSGK